MMGPILFWPFISTHSHIDIILYNSKNHISYYRQQFIEEVQNFSLNQMSSQYWISWLTPERLLVILIDIFFEEQTYPTEQWR